ncbi:MAG: hypothetical protein DMF61_27540 [Blastocatellia bacterium AA13]|nr:MAG: hypothetical protein DMF61_27540 [Blastocatellia bacterium AA13]
MANTKNQEANSTLNQAADYAREAADRVSDMGSRVAGNVKEIGRQVQSRIDDMDIDETTIPDAFRGAPKLISPRVHAWLDVAVTTYFLGLGVWFAVRGKGPNELGVIATTDWDAGMPRQGRRRRAA